MEKVLRKICKKLIHVMLQSAVNLLGNKSAVWNSQYLKKILRIPEDQLKILNSIPGWSSETNFNKTNPSLTTSVNRDNLLATPATIVTETIVNKEIPVINLKVTEEQLDNTYRKESFPLRKSSSLDSISIQKSNFPPETLKKSSSTSNIKDKTLLSNIEETKEMQVDVDCCSVEKALFANSGVQCKMSQDLNSDGQIQTRPSNYASKRESLKMLNAFSVSNQTNGGAKTFRKSNLFEDENNQVTDVHVQLKENVNKKTKISIDERSLNGKLKTDIEESYISQSVPSAQPSSENVNQDKELHSDQESVFTTQKKSFSSTSKDMQSSLGNTNFHSTGKRKRKSRQEKSKKQRSINSDCIKIEYSPEQIKNMLALIKSCINIE